MSSAMPYGHDISACVVPERDVSGSSVRLSEQHLSALFAELKTHMQAIVHERLPILDLPKRSDNLTKITETAHYLRENFERIVLLGTGGSSLGSRALSEMSARHGKVARLAGDVPQLDIITNVDPFYFRALLENLPEKTAWVVVSKSGSTVETLMQFLTVLPKFGDNISNSAVIITESDNSPLGQLARKYKIPILYHDKDIGGRYSVLSVVGILPSLIMGLSEERLRDGAATVVEALRRGTRAENFAPAQGAAISVGLNRYNSIGSHVMLAYSDRLGSLSRWYRQLWAESVGKGGLGTTPIYAMGPVDQHSQLQLWLDGPRDKLFTVMSAPFTESTGLSPDSLAGISGVDYLRGCSLSKLMEASKRATADALSDLGLPVRHIDLPRLDEYHVGALMMHFMIETILSARLLGVNPFDQPAVEGCKGRVSSILREAS